MFYFSDIKVEGPSVKIPTGNFFSSCIIFCKVAKAQNESILLHSIVKGMPIAVSATSCYHLYFFTDGFKYTGYHKLRKNPKNHDY